MTWSIIARDPATGQFGIAVATRFFAVGARVPYIAAGLGAIATQALVNPYYGIDGVKLLREGLNAHDVLAALLATRRRPREAGRSTSWTPAARSPRTRGATASTGAAISQAAASRSPATCWPAPTCSTRPAKTYIANDSLPFPRRLLTAMRAGEAAGGDKRGKQSAALLIHGEEEWPALDLRADDHPDPLGELERLGTGQPASSGSISALPCRRGRTRPATPIAASSTPASLQRAGESRTSARPLIEIEDLRVRFHGDDGRITHAVDSVDLSVANGATLGLVGESGCGKSVTSLAIMGLLPKQSGRRSPARSASTASICCRRRDQTLRDLRGNRLAMIFQEPMTSLNPSFTIGDQIIETILRHRGGSRQSARERAIELLRRVHIPSPEQRIDEYPHKLSGGMRQRVMIAMALACDPQLLIADEPTTALDVTLQAQILELMRELKAASGAAIILITHDLGVVAEVCDEVAVMYAGEIVERAPVDELFCHSAASLHRRPARLDPAARPSRRAARDDRGHGAEHDAAARRLPLRRALPVRAGRLHQAPPPLDRSRPRPPLALHPRAARTCWCRDGAARGRRPGQAFRRRAFAVRPATRACQGGRWRQLLGRGRQDAGPGRRIRLRQIHGQPPGAAADRAGCRHDPFRRP